MPELIEVWLQSYQNYSEQLGTVVSQYYRKSALLATVVHQMQRFIVIGIYYAIYRVYRPSRLEFSLQKELIYLMKLPQHTIFHAQTFHIIALYLDLIFWYTVQSRDVMLSYNMIFRYSTHYHWIYFETEHKPWGSIWNILLVHCTHYKTTTNKQTYRWFSAKRRKSIGNGLELRLSGTNPPICLLVGYNHLK